jgi:hypothetical protein
MKRAHEGPPSLTGESSKCPFFGGVMLSEDSEEDAPLPPVIDVDVDAAPLPLVDSEFLEIPGPPLDTDPISFDFGFTEPSSSDWLSPYAILDEYDYFKAEDQNTERDESPEDQDDLDSESFDSSEESDVPLDEVDNMLEEGQQSNSCMPLIVNLTVSIALFQVSQKE